MAYKKWTKSEETLRPDPRFNSKLASKFVNCMMWNGKKAVAQRIFYDAMETVANRIKDQSPIEVFEGALNNIKPSIEVRSRRVGGSNYQVPMPVARRRQQSLAIRWLLEATRAKAGKPMSHRLAAELSDAFHNEGAAVTKRENVHKMADANKAFAHVAW